MSMVLGGRDDTFYVLTEDDYKHLERMARLMSRSQVERERMYAEFLKDVISQAKSYGGWELFVT